MLFAPVLFALVLQVQPPACSDVPTCRQAALEAKDRKDYEAFHDLAWVAYRKGKADDPELMLLLARAQSLSGRSGDAVVMLERLAARGATTDVATSEDFEAVRQHPRWKGAAPSTPVSTEERTAKVDPTVAPSAKGNPPVPAPGTKPDVSPVAPSAKVDLSPGAPSVKGKPPGAVSSAKPDLSPEARGAKPELGKAPAAKKSATLGFTTLLSPTALAYDAVSKRYLIADRQAKRIAVVDENTGSVSMLAGGQARLGEIHGMAIDPRQGDLWVVSSADEGMSLSRLQLVSGREVSGARVRGVRGTVGGVAFVRGTGLVVSDQYGDIYKVAATGQAEKIGSLEYVPTALGADGDGILYVAAGATRIARFSIAPFRRLGIIDLEADMGAGLPFAVVRDSIHVVAAVGGAFEIRTQKK